MDTVGRDCTGILVYSASAICGANRKLVSLELRGASDGKIFVVKIVFVGRAAAFFFVS